MRILSIRSFKFAMFALFASPLISYATGITWGTAPSDGSSVASGSVLSNQVRAENNGGGCGKKASIRLQGACYFNEDQQNQNIISNGGCVGNNADAKAKVTMLAGNGSNIVNGHTGKTYTSLDRCRVELWYTSQVNGSGEQVRYYKIQQRLVWDERPESNSTVALNYPNPELSTFEIKARTTTADENAANRIDIATTANGLMQYRITQGGGSVCNITGFGLVTPLSPGVCEVEAYYDSDLENIAPIYEKTKWTFVMPDSDGDGILDNVDNCPFTYNPDQADMDGDGVGDACDDDIDGDGIPNEVDNCPYVANPGQESTVIPGIGDACLDPNADHDGDGIPDIVDNCPITPNGPLAGASQFWQEIEPGQNVGTRKRFKNVGTEQSPEWIEATDGTHIQADLLGNGIGDACNPDIDGDGVPNSLDNCPYVVNPNQEPSIIPGIGEACYDENGDQDGDGIPDKWDNCPFHANGPDNDPDNQWINVGTGNGNFRLNSGGVWVEDSVNGTHIQQDTDGDGVGDVCDADIDGDGIPNEEDNCPFIANSGQEDTTGSGVGDACERVYVTHTGTNDENCGSSWTNACSIKKGIEKALDSGLTELNLRAGTYQLNEAIHLEAGISLVGGFNGAETAGQGPNASKNKTKITRNTGVLLEAKNLGTELSDTVIVNGLIFESSDTSASNDDAAVIVDNSRVIFVGGEVSENNGGNKNAAGVLVKNAGYADFRGTAFKANQAGTGAAIYNDNSTVILTDAKFEENESGMAGAIFQKGANANVRIRRVSFKNNESSNNGGAILGENGVIDLEEGTVFTTNKAGGDGGAIAVQSSAKLNTEFVVFENNHANNDGGAVSLNSANDHLLSASLFRANYAKGMGGALHIQSGNTATVVNNTFFKNASGSDAQGAKVANANGGAIVVVGGANQLYHNTLVDNTAHGGQGGGLYISAGSTDLQGNLITGNHANSVDNARLASLAGTSKYNLFGHSGQAGISGTAANSLTPEDGLAKIVKTELGKAGGDGYSSKIPMLAIIGGGSARDAIPETHCVIQADARGQERPDWKSGDEGEAACDMGAYEFTVLSCEEDARRRYAQGELFIKSCDPRFEKLELKLGSANYFILLMLSIIGGVRLYRRK